MDELNPGRPIWLDDDGLTVKVIDQRKLPHALEILELTTVDQAVEAIVEMVVRGAPLIGVTGAYGVMLAAAAAGRREELEAEARRIKAARPTAVNLAWAVDRTLAAALQCEGKPEQMAAARSEAGRIADEEAENCRRIGIHGARLIQEVSLRKKGQTVNILTHCNAGWLACVQWGTATAPIYMAHRQGIKLHVWVDETRPLNQGVRLTAWELGRRQVPHTVIVDNAGGHLMQRGLVDMVIVGTDRTTAGGDVANKIGTYLKALAARDNNVPFYVALPSSTFDWEISDGLGQIPIEERDPDEVRYVHGLEGERPCRVLIAPLQSPAANPAFDVTPARLVTGLITERGVCRATSGDIARLFPDKAGAAA